MCHVLIATPNNDLHRMLTGILNMYFANVIILPHGKSNQEILTIAQTSQPEIVILELHDSLSAPFNLQNKLLELHPNLRTIIIDKEESCYHAQKSIRMGAIDYLVHPLIEDDVLNSIHRAIISLNQVSLLPHHDTDFLATHNEMISPMIQYIHDNFEKQLTLDILSDFMHLNKNYLSHLFKKEIGMSFIAYLTEYRVSQAKLRLRTTTDTLADIAHQIGYNDPAYFSRIFKKIADLTPNQYRQTYSGETIPISSTP